MIFIYGRKTSKIKTATDHIGVCSSCNSIGLEFEIYRDYFHLFWIPLFPLGRNKFGVRCPKCGQSDNLNPRVEHFKSITGTPVYLFSGSFLIAVLIGSMVIANLNKQKEKALFVGDPKVGDVYMMRENVNDTTFYYFLRVARIQNDSVIVYPNIFRYFGFVSKLNEKDHFITEEFFYTKKELRDLLDNHGITSVERGYGDYEGFNRIETVVRDSIK